MRPVTQNAQSTAQPACEETQIVTRAASGVSGSVHDGFFFDSTMYTASTRAPSASSKRNFSVPSGAAVRVTIFGSPIVNSRASASRIAFGRFDISAEPRRAALVDPLRDLGGAVRLRRDVAHGAREVERRETEKIDRAQPRFATVDRIVTAACGRFFARGSGASGRSRRSAGSRGP